MRFNYINSMMQRMNRAVGDAATSALDSESEALVQGALENLMAGRTSIVVAHRLSTVAALDRIVVLEDGVHAELSRAGGVYESLWDRQTGASSKRSRSTSHPHTFKAAANCLSRHSPPLNTQKLIFPLMVLHGVT